MALLFVLGRASAAPVTVPARPITYRPTSHAWAQVRSVAPLILRAPLATQVAQLDVVPGQVVAAGARLAELSGPQNKARLAEARARVVARRAEVRAARETAASVKRNYPALSDRRELDSARSALAAAKGRLAEAEAEVQALRTERWMTSPVAAVVQALHTASGEFLAPGAAVVTLLPEGHTWLRAELFGGPVAASAAARFVPDDGPTVAVHWVADLAARAANGARIANFAPDKGQPPLQVGQTGELLITGRRESAVAVPAQSLILDAGHWYVLVKTAGGLKPVQVTPGPSRGDLVVVGGVQAGTPVVARQAYLLYHRNFAALYTPPD